MILFIPSVDDDDRWNGSISKNLIFVFWNPHGRTRGFGHFSVRTKPNNRLDAISIWSFDSATGWVSISDNNLIIPFLHFFPYPLSILLYPIVHPEPSPWLAVPGYVPAFDLISVRFMLSPCEFAMFWCILPHSFCDPKSMKNKCHGIHFLISVVLQKSYFI